MKRTALVALGALALACSTPASAQERTVKITGFSPPVAMRVTVTCPSALTHSDAVEIVPTPGWSQATVMSKLKSSAPADTAT